MAKLQLQVGDDGCEIGVAATLAVAVHAALHVRKALLDGRQGVRHGHVGIVVRVNTEHAVETLAYFGRDLLQPSGDGPAVGVAQAQHVRAGLLGGFECPQGEIRLVRVTVEKMLGVVDHFSAVIFQIRHCIGDQLEVFLFSDSQRAARMQLPTLAEDGHHRRPGVQQLAHVAVFFDRVLGKARGSECG